MKKTFIEFYRPTESEMKKLWEECLFIFDANVLLDLYRSSDKVRKGFFKFFQANKTRIWIPHQFAHEYHKDRLGVISMQKKSYDQVNQLFDDYQKKITNDLKSYKKHSLIKVDTYLRKIKVCFDSIRKAIKEKNKKHPPWSNENDIIREKITKFFEKRVGPSYTNEKLNEIFREGKDRYSKEKPPGYCDSAKHKKEQNSLSTKYEDERSIYGDLIGWFQIIDKAKEIKKPIILVTNDLKIDWWQEIDGEKIGPRYELIREIYDNANVKFWMFTMERFSKQAKFESDVIREIQEESHSDPSLDDVGGAISQLLQANGIISGENSSLTDPVTGTASCLADTSPLPQSESKL